MSDLKVRRVDPLFIHDCKRCVFIGHFTDVHSLGTPVVDGYVCQHYTAPNYMGSVVLRYSDEGWEYSSFPLETVRRMQQRRDAGEPGEEGSLYTDVIEAFDARVRKCRHNAGQGANPRFAPHLKEGEVQCRDCGHIEQPPPPLTYDDCLDGPEGCSGSVEYRYALSGTGRSYPRCDTHWEERCRRQEEINSRYGGALAPSDFDPYYAGERWDDDY